MITVISRIIHYGLKNFYRNGLLSTATVAIVTLCLLVFAGLLLANATTRELITLLQNKIDIAIYFKTTTPEDQILAIKSSMENLPEVKSIEYISAGQALAIFKERHAGEVAIQQSLEELSSNPFEASLNISATDPSHYDSIAEYLKTPEVGQYLDTDNPVSYENKKEAINRLAAIVNSVNRAGLLLTIILSLISGLVVFNTIRLVIYSNRDEIIIMRAVGASNTFVRGPYVMEGIIIGFIAAVASLVLIFIGLLIAPFFAVSNFSLGIPDFTILSYLGRNFFTLLGYQLLFGIGLTVISSFIAVRRYLKN